MSRVTASSSRRVVWFRLLTVGTGLLTALILAEILLRSLGLGYGNIPFDPDPQLHHVNPRNYNFVSYSPFGEYGGFEVRFNPRGERVLDSPVSRGARFRLALMGDSFAAGLEVPAPESMAGLLARWGQSETEVRNFAVTSYSPVLYNLQWEATVRAFEPTHVLVLLYANDPLDDETYAALSIRDATGKVVAVPHGDSPVLRQLSRGSYLIRFARKKIAEWSRRKEKGTEVGGFFEPNPELGPWTQSSLLELRTKVEATGCRFLVSAVPSKAIVLGKLPAQAPSFEERIRGWAGAQGVDYVDLKPFFETASRGGPPFFPRDIHWNARGNQAAAAAVASHLPDLFPNRVDSR